MSIYPLQIFQIVLTIIWNALRNNFDEYNSAHFDFLVCFRRGGTGDTILEKSLFNTTSGP